MKFVFDLDGTLLNTLEALTYTTNLTLKEFGYGPVGEEQVKQFVGDGYRMQVKRALQYCGDEKLTHYEEALSVYMKLFAEHCLYHESVFGKGYFDVVAGQKDEIPKKPDPAGVNLILEQFGCKPEECLYFGDTNTDMQTGLNAKAHTVGVTWGFRGREELEAFHPDFVIDEPQTVIEKILKFYV